MAAGGGDAVGGCVGLLTYNLLNDVAPATVFSNLTITDLSADPAAAAARAPPFDASLPSKLGAASQGWLRHFPCPLVFFFLLQENLYRLISR